MTRPRASRDTGLELDPAHLGQRPIRRVPRSTARAGGHEQLSVSGPRRCRARTSTSTIARRARRRWSASPAQEAKGNNTVGHRYQRPMAGSCCSGRRRRISRTTTRTTPGPVPARSADRDDHARQRRSRGSQLQPAASTAGDERGRPHHRLHGPGPRRAGLARLYLRERETGRCRILSDGVPRQDSAEPLRVQLLPFSVATANISDDGRIVAVVETARPPITVPRPLPTFMRYLLHDRLTGRTLATAMADSIESVRRLHHGPVGRRAHVSAAPGRARRPCELVDRVSGLRETIPDGAAGLPTTFSLSSDGRSPRSARRMGAGHAQQIYVYDRDSGDGDGMPSAWETLFGLNPTNLTDASADADLDGVTNLQEYLRGTHPNAVASATRYFAEGAANAFFTTRLAAVNPGDEAGGRGVPLPRQRAARHRRSRARLRRARASRSNCPRMAGAGQRLLDRHRKRSARSWSIAR